MSKLVLITGATSGIGYAAAELLAANGHRLIVTGRRVDKLKSLGSSLKEKHGVDVKPLPFDVSNSKEVEEAINSLPPEWRGIDILINNAGLAVGLSPIHSGELDDWERMIDTNVKGLLYVTRHVANTMVDQGRGGHIVNIGSIAGTQVYANGNVYCATKHAVNALSQAMRIDLLSHGIRVTEIRPGQARTEFSLVRFKGDGAKAESTYNGFTPLSAEDIAEAILFAITRPQHVNINEIEITPAAQASIVYTHKAK